MRQMRYKKGFCAFATQTQVIEHETSSRRNDPLCYEMTERTAPSKNKEWFKNKEMLRDITKMKGVKLPSLNVTIPCTCCLCNKCTCCLFPEFRGRSCTEEICQCRYRDKVYCETIGHMIKYPRNKPLQESLDIMAAMERDRERNRVMKLTKRL